MAQSLLTSADPNILLLSIFLLKEIDSIFKCSIFIKTITFAVVKQSETNDTFFKYAPIILNTDLRQEP